MKLILLSCVISRLSHKLRSNVTFFYYLINSKQGNLEEVSHVIRDLVDSYLFGLW